MSGIPPFRKTVRGKKVTVFPSENGDSPMVVLNTFREEGKEVYESVRGICRKDFSFVAVSDIDWNGEMSPWPAPPVLGEERFTGRADAFLKDLTECIIPAVRDTMSADPGYMMIAGYSMAGLFALYSLYRTRMFSRAVCASGSLWYPGIVEFIRDNETIVRPERICMSLGDTESRIGNKVMASVGDNTQRIHDMLSGRYSNVILRMDRGNHFSDPVERIVKSIAWTLE